MARNTIKRIWKAVEESAPVLALPNWREKKEKVAITPQKREWESLLSPLSPREELAMQASLDQPEEEEETLEKPRKIGPKRRRRIRRV